MSVEVEPSLLERLRQAACDAADAARAAEDRRQLRDQLVLLAADAGIQQRAIVKASGISKARVIQVIATQTARS